jgi:hypothetical protein
MFRNVGEGLNPDTSLVSHPWVGLGHPIRTSAPLLALCDETCTEVTWGDLPITTAGAVVFVRRTLSLVSFQLPGNCVRGPGRKVVMCADVTCLATILIANLAVPIEPRHLASHRRSVRLTPFIQTPTERPKINYPTQRPTMSDDEDKHVASTSAPSLTGTHLLTSMNSASLPEIFKYLAELSGR